MSELTTPIRIDIPGIGSIESADLYLKSEVDNAIAEQKDKLQNVSSLLKETREWLVESQKLHKRCADNAVKVIRHNKYKRCLAKAERCKDKIENAVQYNEHDDWLIINEYWERWLNRWLKIAEQFKEAK